MGPSLKDVVCLTLESQSDATFALEKLDVLVHQEVNMQESTCLHPSSCGRPESSSDLCSNLMSELSVSVQV